MAKRVPQDVRISYATRVLWLLGCVTDPTLQALVDARADQAVADSQQTIRLAVGAAAMAAELAPVSDQAWKTLDGQRLLVDEGTSAALGLGETGLVRANLLTGEVSVTWEAIALDGDTGQLTMVVVRPLQTFSFVVSREPDGAIIGRGTAQVVDAREAPRVTVSWSSQLDGTPLQTFDLPAESDAVWPEVGLLPVTGDFVWRQELDGLDRLVTGQGVEGVDEGYWPVVVSAQDWAALREVPIIR